MLPATRYKLSNEKTPDLRFHARLSEGEREVRFERIELARA
jgi:hypothetical protein